jgi:hypothetical protein
VLRSLLPLLPLLWTLLDLDAAPFRVVPSAPDAWVFLDPDRPPPYITMETLAREVAALRSLMEANTARIDQALTSLAKVADHMPTEMDTKVTHLQQLITETVHRLELQTSVAQQSVRDALIAGEKMRAEQQRLTALAIDKAEKTAADERQDIQDALARGLSGLREQVQALKERLDRFEGERSGVGNAWAVLLALLGVAGAIVGFVRGRRPAPRT